MQFLRSRRPKVCNPENWRRCLNSFTSQRLRIEVQMRIIWPGSNEVNPEAFPFPRGHRLNLCVEENYLMPLLGSNVNRAPNEGGSSTMETNVRPNQGSPLFFKLCLPSASTQRLESLLCGPVDLRIFSRTGRLSFGALT